MSETPLAKYRQRVIWLMMPGGDLGMVRKATRYAPDVIIPCLEDGVAYHPDAKATARRALSTFLREGGHTELGIATFPRINHPSSPYWGDDVDALVAAGADGIVIPKCETVDEVRVVEDRLSEAEAATGVPAGSVPVVVMLETARGVLRAAELALSARRGVALLFGREDFSASIGLMRRHSDSLAEGSPELLYARSQVVLAAQAAGLGSIDGASFTFQDADYMLRDASLSARIGYTGKLAAHPGHVRAIRQGFAPEPADVAIAERIVELERAALANGEAPVGGVDGMEVTPPIVDQARLLLARVNWASRVDDRLAAAAEASR
ncbi:MAG: hypothetical protein GEV12_00080 [Micromonosporaceae bacterium]|nr:hypothetical protein [Micromonosporaceae bacterium]